MSDRLQQLMLLGKPDAGKTLAWQYFTHSVITSIKQGNVPEETFAKVEDTLRRKLGNYSKLLYFAFSAQEVSGFFDTVVIDVECAKQGGIPFALQALSLSKGSGMNQCNKLVMFVDTVASFYAEDASVSASVFGRGLKAFTLHSSEDMSTKKNDFDGLHMAVKALKYAKHTLTYLSLNHVGLGDGRGGTTAFATLCDGFISNNFVLATLDLSHNSIDDQHVNMLLKALKTCPSLTCLDLLDNRFTDASVSAFAKAKHLQLLELVLGDAKVEKATVVFDTPMTYITLTAPAYKTFYPEDMLIMVQNEDYYEDDGISSVSQWLNSAITYYKGKYVQLHERPNATKIKSLILVVYDDDIAERITHALQKLGATKFLPNLTHLEIYGCKSTSSSTVIHRAPFHSCLRQHNTHLILDNNNDQFLNVVLAGVNLPFGEDALKDDTPIDLVQDPAITQYNSFWMNETACLPQSSRNAEMEQHFTTTLTVLASNPVPDGAAFVLKNKVKMRMDLFQTSQEKDGVHYRGALTVTFLTPCQAEQELFATTTDPKVNSLLRHWLLSDAAKNELTRAGLGLFVHA